MPPITIAPVDVRIQTAAKRSPQLPNVPTVAKQGVPGFDVSSWYGICGQSGLPKPVFEKLRTDLLTALGRTDVKKRLTDQGIEAKTSTPEEFVAFSRQEIARWSRVVKEAKIPEQWQATRKRGRAQYAPRARGASPFCVETAFRFPLSAFRSSLKPRRYASPRDTRTSTRGRA
jgi:hypothetical protein